MQLAAQRFSIPDRSGYLLLYASWPASLANRHIDDADAVIVTSYCPDAMAAYRQIFSSRTHAVRVFYDLDTPVTLARLAAGEPVDYLPSVGLRDFDLVLSYTGGGALAGAAIGGVAGAVIGAETTPRRRCWVDAYGYTRCRRVY